MSGLPPVHKSDCKLNCICNTFHPVYSACNRNITLAQNTQATSARSDAFTCLHRKRLSCTAAKPYKVFHIVISSTNKNMLKKLCQPTCRALLTPA